MLGEKRDIFIRREERDGVRRGGLIEQPALFRLLDPLLGIVVAVEEYALMFLYRLAYDCERLSVFVFSFLEAVGEALERLGDYRV